VLAAEVVAAAHSEMLTRGMEIDHLASAESAKSTMNMFRRSAGESLSERIGCLRTVGILYGQAGDYKGVTDTAIEMESLFGQLDAQTLETIPSHLRDFESRVAYFEAGVLRHRQETTEVVKRQSIGRRIAGLFHRS
jgi:hypothetical protein